MVSVIIPARNEKYLENTIKNVLENARGEIEIIVVLDGYLPDPQIKLDDSRVRFLHNEVARGQRQSINQAVAVSNGKYIMKLDAHCAVDEGFDIKLKADCEYNWTIIPRMYNLDVSSWKPKLIEDTDTAIRRRKLHDYMYIGWNDKNELRTLYYRDRENYKLHQRTEQIDDIMSCMGCCFFMYKERFLETGGCDEGHGGWGQQGIEVSLKAWLSGGALKVNKKTWFAHWFRASDGGFPYDMSGKAVSRARKYSQELWLNDKWEKQVRTLEWVLNKFNPPSWEGRYLNRKILNLGSGNMPKTLGVINVDAQKNDNVDVVSDIRKLPYEDNSIDEIRSSNVIEHFGKHEVLPLLQEWVRVLKTGGILDIHTVDARRTLERWQTIPWTRLCDSLMGHQSDEYQFHKVMFDRDSFSKYLQKAGFKVNKLKRYTSRSIPRMQAICTKIV